MCTAKLCHICLSVKNDYILKPPILVVVVAAAAAAAVVVVAVVVVMQVQHGTGKLKLLFWHPLIPSRFHLQVPNLQMTNTSPNDRVQV